MADAAQILLLWLWHWLAAVAPVQPLAWKLPYAAGAALKKRKKKKKKEKMKISFCLLCCSTIGEVRIVEYPRVGIGHERAMKNIESCFNLELAVLGFGVNVVLKKKIVF